MQPILTRAPVKTATASMLPTLFGSLVPSTLNEACGDYRAKGKFKAIVLPVVLVFGANLVYPLAGEEEFELEQSQNI